MFGFEQRKPHGETFFGGENLDVAPGNQLPAVAQVLQTDARRGLGFELRTPRIRDLQAIVFHADRNVQRIVARDGIVLDSVVDKRLERKRRQPPRIIAPVDLQIEEELVRIADLEKIAVRLDELVSSPNSTSMLCPFWMM